MRNKQSGRVFNYNRVNAHWWGTIAPPETTRFSDTIQEQGSVYLDIGTSGRSARNVFSATYHATEGGGFATRASGVYPVNDWELTTKAYSDLAGKVDKDEGIFINSGVAASGSIVRAKLGELRRKTIRVNETFTISAGYDYNSNREVILDEGAELVIEAGGELFVDTGGAFCGQYNVKNYGEFDEGSDITAPLQAAINAAGVAGGGEVTIPKGSFTLGVPATGTGYSVLVDRNNVHIKGAGVGETIITATSGTTDNTGDELIYFSGVDHCTIGNMTIHGQNNWRNGLAFWGPNFCHAYNMHIHRFDLHAITFRHGAGRPADHNIMENIFAHNQGQTGGLIIYSDSDVSPGVPNKHNRVINCTTSGTDTWYGLELRNTEYTQVDNLTSIGNQHGLNLEEHASYNMYTNCVISGNHKTGLQIHGNVNSGRCINNTFVNCKFTGHKRSTVRDLASDGTKFIGCEFSHNTSGYLILPLSSGVLHQGDGIESRHISWDNCLFDQNSERLIVGRGKDHIMRNCRITNNGANLVDYRRMIDLTKSSGWQFINVFCSGNNDPDAINSADIWVHSKDHHNKQSHYIDESSVAFSQVYPGWAINPGRHVPATRMPPAPHPNITVELIQHSGCLSPNNWGLTASTQYDNYFEIPLGHLSGIDGATGIDIYSRWLALNGGSPVIRFDNPVVGVNYDVPFDSKWHWIKYTIPIAQVSGIDANGGRFLRARLNSAGTEVVCDGYRIEIASGIGGGTIAAVTSLSALTDTTLGTLTSGEQLSYNGSVWVNAFVNASGYQVPSGTYIQPTSDVLWTGDHVFGAGSSLTGDGAAVWLEDQNTVFMDNADNTSQFRWLLNDLAPNQAMQINVPPNKGTTAGYVLLASDDPDNFTSGAFLTVDISGNVITGGFVPSISGHNLESHSDVNRTTIPASGHILSWDGNAWINASKPVGAGAATIAGLNDTSITALVSGHLLGYNGTNWVNSNASSAGGSTTYAALTDTNVSNLASGELARYDGTTWQPFQLFSGILLSNGEAMPTAAAIHEDRMFKVTTTSGIDGAFFRTQQLMTVLSGRNDGYIWVPMSQLVM